MRIRQRNRFFSDNLAFQLMLMRNLFWKGNWLMKMFSPGLAWNILFIFNKNFIKTSKLVSFFNFRSSNLDRIIKYHSWLVWIGDCFYGRNDLTSLKDWQTLKHFKEFYRLRWSHFSRMIKMQHNLFYFRWGCGPRLDRWDGMPQSAWLQLL